MQSRTCAWILEATGRNSALLGVSSSITDCYDKTFRAFDDICPDIIQLTPVRSEVVSQILETMPPDPTDAEDMILASLFSGKPAEALSQASKHDPWLSAHWSDLMENLDLIDSAIDPGYALASL